jgi:hypothetical protein
MGLLHTFDFFNRQRSQALQTRFLMLSCSSIELDLCEDIEESRCTEVESRYTEVKSRYTEVKSHLLRIGTADGRVFWAKFQENPMRFSGWDFGA